MTDTALDTLLAKQEIADRLHDYVRAMDRIDDELGRSVFHSDAPADYGTIYRGTGHGFIDFVHAAHETMLAHTHQLGSIAVEVLGARAASEAYVTVTLRRRADDGTLLDTRSLGRYLDVWEKREGRWAISERRYVHELDEGWRAVEPGYATDGRRDRTDPSYALFEDIAGKARSHR